MHLRVEAVRPVEPDMVVVTFRRSQGSEPLPPIAAGQFVELKLHAAKPLLNRPFSVLASDSDILSLLVKIVGEVTTELAAARPGDEATAIGPLGNTFATEAQRPLLVGGGVGVAPMFALLYAYAAKGVRPTVIIGSRSRLDAKLVACFREYSDLTVCTDDGSQGFHGIVTACPEFAPADYDIVQCCGPTPMMKAVAAAAAAAGTHCQVSLENKMACGLGACLCCVQEMADGHRKCVCSEGPIFNSADVKW